MVFLEKIVEKLMYYLNKLVADDVKNLFFDLKEYKNEPKMIIVFFICTPLTTIFIVLNATVFIICFLSYFILFIKNLIMSYINNRISVIICKTNKRFFKNFHIIIFEKIMITFPKKKAFLVFYILMKKMCGKDNVNLEKELIINWFKSISNRYLIVLLIGVPYIVLYYNNELVKLIFNLKEFNYESKKAFLNTIILNIYKNVTPDYIKLIEKLKIEINSKEIIFNSDKEIIKALKHIGSFSKSFKTLKKDVVFGSVKHKVNGCIYSKSHPTAMLKTKVDKVAYINESSQKQLNIHKFNEKEQQYVIEKLDNNHQHKGSVDTGKITFYTKPIETEKKNILLLDPTKDKMIITDIREENINNITASFTINLESEILKTKTVEIDGNKSNILIKENVEKKFIQWVVENKDTLKSSSYESLFAINSFWEENEVIIKEMTIENKTLLAKMLGIDLGEFDDAKKVNFKIFISFIGDGLKLK